MARSVYLALLHFPINDRNGKLVATSVTNLDIHDIARSARTYGLKGYFLVTPVQDQHRVVGRILDHWQLPKNREFHPDRVKALDLVKLLPDMAAVREQIEKETGLKPEVILTDARERSGCVTYQALKNQIADDAKTQPLLLIFGTGWGVSEVFFPEIDQVLEPIRGAGSPEDEGYYNHLSVRAAAAIILDRLLGV